MAGQHILFRVDASLFIGTGHVMRCLTLAHALAKQGATCRFICREHEGHLNDYIRAQGFTVLPLPFAPSSAESHANWLGVSWQTDAAQTLNAIGTHRFDWLIVDHYALDARWETALHTAQATLMVIDDLADRPHSCALLLDPSLGHPQADYAGSDCLQLHGPAYALLRPEFAALRAESLQRRAAGAGLKTLLITMGGVDRHNVTGDVLAALKSTPLPDGTRIRVVMGPQAPWLTQVRTKAKTMPWPTEVLVGVANMGQLMAQSDLAIGAVGTTSWERCCMGLPTLALVLADNQRAVAQGLQRAGAIALLGDARTDGWKARLAMSLRQITPATLATLSQKAADTTDGTGRDKCLAAMRTRLSLH